MPPQTNIISMQLQIMKKSFFLILLICLLVTSCSPNENPSSVETEQHLNGVDFNLSPQPTSLANGMGCALPYTKTSIWNVPVDWSKAKIHPDSKKMMDAFWNGTRWIGSDPAQYAPNIYFVDVKTPLVPVKLRKNRFRDAFDDKEIQYGEPAATVWMPIPSGALPAPGTDGQMVLINVDTGEEWGLNKGTLDPFGVWFANGIYRYSIQNSGVPPEGFGQRGAGIGNFSGIVRKCEVDRGVIEHAVTIAYDYPCTPETCRANGWPEFIPPFTKTDGRGTSAYDIPEGARMVIRPEIARDEIVAACSGMQGCIVWVIAMQEYGGFLVDNSDHPKTYPEGDATANWDPKIWSDDMLRNIPPEWYDILDWNYPSTSAR